MDDAVPIPRDRTLGRVAAVLIWGGAFFYSLAFFLPALRLLHWVPPTDAVAVGRVTVAGASKARDYLGAALFFLLVPCITIFFASAGRRALHRLLRPMRSSSELSRTGVIALFAAPFFFAPLFDLTTGREVWGLLLPLALALAASLATVYVQTHRWIRELCSASSQPFHALVLSEGVAWIVFRYLATGKRIAHISTLFLEVVFVVFFLILFWATVVFVARLFTLLFGTPLSSSFASVAVGAIPLLALPPLGLTFLSSSIAAATLVGLAVLLASRSLVIGRHDSIAVRRIVAWLAVPLVIFCVAYASTASTAGWIDLFHRGESLGPASDFLRGKVPYRDVFVLHGMLEDGLFDAWMMEIFGRSAEVAITRAVIFSALTIPALWLLSLIISDSLPFAAVVAMLGFMTFLDNQRAILEITTVALLLAGILGDRTWAVVAAGIAAGIALFFSLEIGIYSIVGGAASIVALGFAARRAGIGRPSSLRRLGAFLTGVIAGALPFLGYLTLHEALVPFANDSFFVIPSIIDAVWSLPFPDLTTVFRDDLSLRSIADFLLTEKIRYVSNAAVIAIALTYLIVRITRRSVERSDQALVVLTIFALVTQRSALGRADFQHQYFSAFLIVPLGVTLAAVAWRRLRQGNEHREPGARALAVILLIATIPLIATPLWIPDLLSARLVSTIEYRPRLSRIGYLDPAGEIIRERIGLVSAEIRRRVPDGTPIFDFSNQPALYFYADRPNPTRFYQIPILSPERLQLETIRRLDQARPPLVLKRSPNNYDVFDGIDNETRAPALARYIHEHYSFSKKVRGIELWQRNPDVSAAALSSAILPGGSGPVPRDLDTSPRERAVFPAVGSLEGRDQSYWRSDLIAHNPYDEPLSFRMRYLSPPKAYDRELTVEPHQVVAVTDFIETFFAAPNSRGALWIEYRQARRPIVRVKTYDSTRSGSASVDTPLAIGEAAAAAGPFNELTLVGASVERGDQLNIGVINAGDEPLIFRITVNDDRGNAVGNPIEGAVEEDSSYLLIDAPSALGVAVGQTMTIRVRVLAGRAIAYASLTDRSSGNHQIVRPTLSIAK